VTGVGGPEDGQAVPSGMLPAATFMISNEEWLLLVPPAGAHPGMLRRTALAWLDSAPPPPGGSVAFLPLPSIDQALGPTVLHHRPGGTAIYCREDDLGEAAAEMLSLIVGTSTPVLIANAARYEPPRAKVIAVSHDRWLDPARDMWLHPSLHPVIAHIALPQATIYTCGCQVTSALADVLTTLGAEQLRLLHAHSAGQMGTMRQATLPIHVAPATVSHGDWVTQELN
jgi:hypothetical protein